MLRVDCVVFGGNFTNAVTFLGAPGVDNLAVGTAAVENFVAGNGNDLMIGDGGLDVFLGGTGDDIIKISKFNFQLVDENAGNDTLAVTGSSLNLDLADMRDQIDGIETIGLTSNGSNTLTVNALDLLNLSDTGNTLKVDGNEGDSIAGLESGWSDGGISDDYHAYVRDSVLLLA